MSITGILGPIGIAPGTYIQRYHGCCLPHILVFLRIEVVFYITAINKKFYL